MDLTRRQLKRIIRLESRSGLSEYGLARKVSCPVHAEPTQIEEGLAFNDQKLIVSATVSHDVKFPTWIRSTTDLPLLCLRKLNLHAREGPVPMTLKD
jgi:hypothetical protein